MPRTKLNQSDLVALDFFERHPGAYGRDLFENGPIGSLGEARAIIRKLSRAGLIDEAQTAKGGHAGWCLTDTGRSLMR